MLGNLLLDFVICSKKYKSIFATCASKSCVIVTRLALRCVCDHEIFMRFEIVLLLYNVHGILRDLLVLVWRRKKILISDFIAERVLSSLSVD